MAIRRSPGNEILLHFRWRVATGALSPAMVAKLAPYITRYAETLNVRVHAVGGVSDHLHILVDLPSEMPADHFVRDLQPPTARYLRDVLGSRTFTWETPFIVVSVSPVAREAVTAYLSTQETRHASGDLDPVYEGTDTTAVTASDDDLPKWLADALKPGS